MAYTTLAEMKTSLSLGSQTYADTDITNAINAASSAIDQMAGRTFNIDGSPSTRKFLPISAGFCARDDLASCSTFTVSCTAWTQDTEFYLEPINAAADGRPYTGIRSIGRQFIFTVKDLEPSTANFDGRVSVTGTYGWPSVPEDIKEACRILAARLLKRVRESTFGVVGLGYDGMTMRISGSDPDVEALIRPYSKTFIGA